MTNQSVTFILNGNTYRFCASDSETIRQMPKADRQQLIALLEAVKQQDILSERAINQAASKVSSSNISNTASTKANFDSPIHDTITTAASEPSNPERLGEGDIDNLMSRLIMEERTKNKPQVTPQKIYTWAGAILMALILLAYLF